MPESLSKWTITYSDFSYLEGEFSGTIHSNGRLRLHTTTSHQSGNRDIDAKVSADEIRTVYQNTREIMNWHRFEDHKGPSPGGADSDVESRLTLTTEDGRFVRLTMVDWSDLGVEPQAHAIAAICNKYIRRAGARWGMHDEGFSGQPRRKPQPFDDGIIPKALKDWDFGAAHKSWSYGLAKRIEGGASRTTFSDYALCRKIFNGYELRENDAKTKDADAPPRVVLYFESNYRNLQLNVDRETLERLGVLEEYTRLAKNKEARFLLPWETP